MTEESEPAICRAISAAALKQENVIVDLGTRRPDYAGQRPRRRIPARATRRTYIPQCGHIPGVCCPRL
ncbi:MAG: hypothetical protein ACLSHO_11010 [Dysosmobacter sp.]